MKIANYDVVVHWGGSIAKALKSEKLVAIQKIETDVLITLKEILIIVSHVT